MKHNMQLKTNEAHNMQLQKKKHSMQLQTNEKN